MGGARLAQALSLEIQPLHPRGVLGVEVAGGFSFSFSATKNQHFWRIMVFAHNDTPCFSFAPAFDFGMHRWVVEFLVMSKYRYLEAGQEERRDTDC